jgi:alpha-L-fucosidase
MFLCWGPVSLTGKEIGWSRGEPAGGRRPGMRGGKGPTPIEMYDNLYKKWKPDKFDAEHWVQVAKDTGMKYLIFLVKHHDGFCLYDSELTDFKSTGAESAWKVDVMKHVADACHKHGLKLMIYYSQPDWHHPDYLSDHHDRYIQYLHGQIQELLTKYGKIDGLWFDNLRSPSPETAKLWDAGILFRMARSIQPQLIINNRCGLPGDYDTPENRVGFFQTNRPWETNATLTGQWAWKPNDPFFRSLEESIHMLVCVVTGDGNFALNTGPMPDGRIEPRQIERFRQIGDWMRKYGESIYSTRGGPFIAPDERLRQHRGYYSHFELPSGRWWGGSTHRDNIIYLHVLRWPSEIISLPAIPYRVTKASVLTGGMVVVKQDKDRIEIRMPKGQRDSLDTIIKLELDGPAAKIRPSRTLYSSLTSGKKATASNYYQNDPQFSPSKAFDDDPDTRWGCDWGTHSAWLAVDLGQSMTFNRAWISEPYGRVLKFELQIKRDDHWHTFHQGTTIGESLLLEFASVTGRQVRLNLLEATEGPSIWEFRLENSHKAKGTDNSLN